jgi:hypothetical protein
VVELPTVKWAGSAIRYVAARSRTPFLSTLPCLSSAAGCSSMISITRERA